MSGSYPLFKIGGIFLQNYIVQTLFSFKLLKESFLLTSPDAKAKVNNVHSITAIFIESCYNLIIEF